MTSKRHETALESFLWDRPDRSTIISDTWAAARRNHASFKPVYCFPSWLFMLAIAIGERRAAVA